jgi:hypothetical protein
MSDTAETLPDREIEKPLGVYVMTAIDFLGFGLVPLIAAFFVIFSPDIYLPSEDIAVAIIVAVMGIVSSIWAMTGDNFGRWLLLVVITVGTLLIVINTLSLMAAGEMTRSYAVVAFRRVLWTGINWWYFNRKETAAYYKRHLS